MNGKRENSCKVVLKVTWIGMLLNLFLSIFKLIVGVVGNSQALFADGIHSMTDLVTDLAVILGVRFWSAPPDENHPYGHLKIETMVATFIGFALLFAAAGIIYNAIVTLEGAKDSVAPSWYVVIGAAATIVCKELLYRWTIKWGNIINSAALVANGEHHRSDAFSSIPVLLATFVAIINPKWSFVDTIGALVVSLFILRGAYKILKSAFADLTDHAVTDSQCSKIAKLAREVEGVKDVHAIRTRRIGMGVYVDLHVLVDGDISVRSGHDIAKLVKHNLLNKGPEIIDVVVHIEPFED